MPKEIERSKEWWLAKAQREGDGAIGAGATSAELKPGYYWVETSAGVEIGLWDATSWRFCAGEPREQFDHTGIRVWSERLTPPAGAIAVGLVA